MANFLTDLKNFVYNVNSLASYMQDAQGKRNNILAAYYSGDHVPQLKTKEGYGNDNVISNYIGLNVNRSVSRMFRGGIRFELPNEQQQEYIDSVWELNCKDILTFQWGLYGAVFGTAYIKIVVDELVNPYTGKQYPRLIALYPDIVRMKTDPQDKEKVIQYRIEWTDKADGKEVVYREDTELNDGGTWTITNYKKEGSAAMVQTDKVEWDYDFAPILHNKNLPSLNSVYGCDEISDVVNIQDRYNFTVSNTGKIIKYHASPTTIVTGSAADAVKPVDKSPNAMFALSSPDAKVFNLEIASDLASSRMFSDDLQRSISSIMREIDISNINDKLGALTNFALRVLYTDALDKNDTKRELYGEAMEEINRRLLVLKGWTGEASQPGEVVWADAMPSNIMEEMQADQLALKMGIIDKETVARRYLDRYGVEWEEIADKLMAEKSPSSPIDDMIRQGMEGNMNNVVGSFLTKQKERVVNNAIG